METQIRFWCLEHTILFMWDLSSYMQFNGRDLFVTNMSFPTCLIRIHLVHWGYIIIFVLIRCKTYVNLSSLKINQYDINSISSTHCTYTCQNYKRAFSHLKIRLFCIHFLLTWTQITTMESAKSNLNIVIFRPRMLLNL